eukprot:4235609-Alexandrium_andersonii.AAC.2
MSGFLAFSQSCTGRRKGRKSSNHGAFGLLGRLSQLSQAGLISSIAIQWHDAVAVCSTAVMAVPGSCYYSSSSHPLPPCPSS